eukprot:152824-Rhodomonas_salina.2
MELQSRRAQAGDIRVREALQGAQQNVVIARGVEQSQRVTALYGGVADSERGRDIVSKDADVVVGGIVEKTTHRSRLHAWVLGRIEAVSDLLRIRGGTPAFSHI